LVVFASSFAEVKLKVKSIETVQFTKMVHSTTHIYGANVSEKSFPDNHDEIAGDLTAAALLLLRVSRQHDVSTILSNMIATVPHFLLTNSIPEELRCSQFNERIRKPGTSTYIFSLVLHIF
jgi:hypothetical protein